MQDILAIIPHGNIKSELVKFFSQYQRDFFPIFPVCIPLCEAVSADQAVSKIKADTLCGADFAKLEMSAVQEASELQQAPLCETKNPLKKLYPLKELKSQFTSTKITLENLQLVNIWDVKNVAALSVKSPNFQEIPFLKDRRLFCPLGFSKKNTSSKISLDSNYKIDFKVFQLAYIRINEKSSKSANEPTLSFSYTILDSVWCK
ncbi:MAG: hypothetical protein IJA53_11945 [Spirochaetaceae bacterium]|nr:hypothetical protein [Spirochaetaceae bacterium]